MPDVQVAIWLRREPGMDGHALEPPPLCDVFVDELMDKMFTLLGDRGLAFLGHVVTLLTKNFLSCPKMDILNYTKC